MSKRVVALAEEAVFTDRETGERVVLSWVPPLSGAYRAYQRALYKRTSEGMLADVGGAMDALYGVALDALVDVKGAFLETPAGERVVIDKALDPRRVRLMTDRPFASWREVFAEVYPEFVQGLAERLFKRLQGHLGVPQDEAEAVEGLSVRASADSSGPGAPASGA
jgi:hypothetical protein